MPRTERVLSGSRRSQIFEVEVTEEFAFRLAVDGEFIYSDGRSLWRMSHGSWYGEAPAGWDRSLSEFGYWRFVYEQQVDYS